MGVDVTLNSVTSGYGVSNINTNFDRIETALDDALSRTGGSGSNVMQADLDMNSNDLLNVNVANIEALVLDGTPVAVSILSGLPSNVVGTTNIVDGSVTEVKLASAFVDTVTRKFTAGTTININWASGNDATGTIVDGGSGSPYKTIQAAFNAASTWDFNWQTVVFQLAASVLYTGLVFSKPFKHASMDTVFLTGSVGAPSSYKITAESGNGISLSNGAELTVQGVFVTAPAGQNFSAITGAKLKTISIKLGPAATGATTGAHFYASRDGYIEVQAGFECAGSAGAMFNAAHKGNIRLEGTNNPAVDAITFTGTPAFSWFIFVLMSTSEMTITNIGTGAGGYWVGSVTGNLGQLRGGGCQWATGTIFPTWPTGLSTVWSLRLGGRFENAITTANEFSYDTTSNQGPDMAYIRAGNPSPSFLARNLYYGDNAVGTSTIFAGDQIYNAVGTAGAESATRQFSIMRAGVYTLEVTFGGGTVFGAPTGGAKGIGTTNALAAYDDNVLLTDLVLDQAVTGTFSQEVYKNHPIASEVADWWFDLDEYASFWRDNRYLPGMISWENEEERPSLGELGTRITAVLETHAVLIQKLNEEIAMLKAMLNGEVG